MYLLKNEYKANMVKCSAIRPKRSSQQKDNKELFSDSKICEMAHQNPLKILLVL